MPPLTTSRILESAAAIGFLTAAKSRQKSRSDEAASAAAHWVESALWSALCWPDLRTDAPAGKVGTSDRVASSPRPEFWKRVR